MASSIQNLEIARADEAAESVYLHVRFSVTGDIREAFTEEKWTQAYEKNDNLFKIKYGVRLATGGLRKKELGAVDSYRKASIFWTRNPKLVNPMKEKRIWVQVAKNFVPHVRLSEEEVRQELFEFDEEFKIRRPDIGDGPHRIMAEVRVSWQKHHYAEPGSAKAVAETEITI